MRDFDAETAAVVDDLQAIARDFAFSWHPDARALYERLDPELYQSVDRNPVALLAALPDDRLASAASDPRVRADAARVRAEIDAERTAPLRYTADDGMLVAYFSLEFALDDSLRIYSGGLGVLAGDHLKSSSELGLPLVAVGLLYRHGYFRQGIDVDGRQLERYPAADPGRLPLTLEHGPDGQPLLVHVQLGGDAVAARIWRADVGRVPLYLLDADIEENTDAARLVTSTLYGGDRDLRIRQEVLLGVGGVRALELLGLRPSVFHMNEGHAAFLAVERLRTLVAADVPLAQALDLVRASTVFTTHTPVPAGNEVFDPELVRAYLAPFVCACGLDWDDFLALGRVGEHDGMFGLTPLALRTSARANGVSELHGAVSRQMWAPLFAGTDVDGVPIGHVTNGVHARTWLAPELQDLLTGAGVRPAEAPSDQAWERAHDVDDAALWRVHRVRKRALGEIVAARAGRFVDPDALTLGFARRFATYKRAGLLFRDPSGSRGCSSTPTGRCS